MISHKSYPGRFRPQQAVLNNLIIAIGDIQKGRPSFSSNETVTFPSGDRNVSAPCAERPMPNTISTARMILTLDLHACLFIYFPPFAWRFAEPSPSRRGHLCHDPSGNPRQRVMRVFGQYGAVVIQVGDQSLKTPSAPAARQRIAQPHFQDGAPLQQDVRLQRPSFDRLGFKRRTIVDLLQYPERAPGRSSRPPRRPWGTFHTGCPHTS